MEIWNNYIPHKLGDTSGDYQRWRAEVMAIRDLPEYKMRKLWKENFSPKDIAEDKHWAIYPPPAPDRKRIAPGTPQDAKRGRTINEKKKAWIYARALHEAAESILTFYRLDSTMLKETRDELENFKQLMRKHSHKSAKET